MLMTHARLRTAALAAALALLAPSAHAQLRLTRTTPAVIAGPDSAVKAVLNGGSARLVTEPTPDPAIPTTYQTKAERTNWRQTGDYDETVRLCRLLEVGCASGLLLKRAIERGWQAEGVELSDAAVADARALGLDVHQGALDDAPLDNKAWTWVVTHLFGGAIAGNDPASSVVAPDLHVRGVRDLHVVDASVIPTTLGVNPQHTIMAVGMVTAQRLASA